MQIPSIAKLTSILGAILLMSAFAATDARADGFCALSVNPSPFVPLGHSFSFGVDINGFGPRPPNPAFTIVFFGNKNGVIDIPPEGQPYPRTFGFGYSELTGYENPQSGGFSGVYTRYAVIFDNNGQFYCVTNIVNVTLE